MRALLILSLLLCLGCNACSTAPVTPGSTPAASATDQTVTMSLVAIDNALTTVPGISQALLNSNTIDTAKYNQIATIYAQTKAVFVVACNAEIAYLNSTDKATAGAKFTQAMTDLEKSYADLQTLITAFGGKL